jgi:hypothetical protein
MHRKEEHVFGWKKWKEKKGEGPRDTGELSGEGR